MGYSLWSQKESDMNEPLSHTSTSVLVISINQPLSPSLFLGYNPHFVIFGAELNLSPLLQNPIAVVPTYITTFLP